jgi:hypothetical protein
VSWLGGNIRDGKDTINIGPSPDASRRSCIHQTVEPQAGIKISNKLRPLWSYSGLLMTVLRNNSQLWDYW